MQRFNRLPSRPSRYMTASLKVNDRSKEPMKAPLIVLSGPSGVGKTTTTGHLLASMPALRRVITFTTRPPRAGEKPGIDYFFASKEAFAQLSKAGAFIETNEFNGNLYGTPRSFLHGLAHGKAYIVLPDINGARAILALVPGALSIWLHAPEQVLEERLKARNTESDESRKNRLRIAQQEAKAARESNLYKRWVDMSDFEKAEKELAQLIQSLLP